MRKPPARRPALPLSRRARRTPSAPVLGDVPCRSDSPDFVAELFCKPLRAIWARHDPNTPRTGSRYGVLSDVPCGSDPPDLVDVELGKPQSAVGPRCNPTGAAGARPGVLSDVPGSGDPPNLAHAGFGKPQRTVWTHSDSAGFAIGSWQGVLGHVPSC